MAVRGGEARLCELWPRKSKKAKEAKEDHQAWVYLDKMVLIVARQGGWTTWALAKDTQAKADKLLKAAKGTVKWAVWQPNCKRKLIFFLGGDEKVNLLLMMMMRWEPQWSRRSVWGSKWVLRISLIALRFYSQIWPSKLLPKSSGKKGGGSLLISTTWKVRGGGAGNRWSTWYFRQLGLDFRS
jgi:hypothetical protein